jgi:hypothetical protein
MKRIFRARRLGQRGGHIINPQCSELVRHAVPIFNMATTHDADNQPLPVAPRTGDRLRHGAVPEQLGSDKTLELFRICTGLPTSGGVLLKPLEQSLAIV